ncbi:MAG: bifunctional UDP-sugar hydrolase/5'-nucleotidase [Bacteroidia bacterium]|nr:bifunctional UDP-sugar hydrolase/5'-nucleotidase [Bacteroidia bacterium]
MKIALVFFLSVSLFLPLPGQTEKKITILHTNDLHSHLTGFAPESAYSPLSVNDDNTVGGFSRIAAIIKTEKESNTGTSLVIDAGDFLMGTLFHSVEIKTGFQLRLMKSMGYDITCFGNHEFDYGPEKMAAIISSSVKNGEIPALLIGNAMFDKKDGSDDGLEKLLSDNLIGRKLILTKDGIKTGIFSILGKDADGVAPKATPVSFAKQSSFAKKMVKEFQAEKCNIIICISHSGVLKDKSGEWGGEDVELAKAVKGIDIIISGHTHTRLDQPLIVNGIPIVQAGEFGQFVGRLSLTYSNGKLRVESYKLIPVDDKIMGDKNINLLIEEQKERITTEILKPLSMNYDRPVIETTFVIEGNEMGDFKESNLGPLVADAIHFYVNGNSDKGTDVSMVAAGVIRDKIIPGIQTAPDIFRVMSLGSGKDDIPGYPLSRLYVTGKELKSILEILQVAYKSKPDNYCYYSGLRVEYDPEKGLLKKIKKIEIIHSDGTAVNVDFSKKNKSLYSVTANSYMLEFFGIIKKMSFGLINVVPKDATGNKVKDMKNAVIDMDENKEGVQEGKEWLALMEFLGSMKDTNGNGIPDIDKKYAGTVKCFFPVKAK